MSILSGNVIDQSPMNTAILDYCRDMYDSTTYLSAVPRDSTPVLGNRKSAGANYGMEEGLIDGLSIRIKIV